MQVQDTRQIYNQFNNVLRRRKWQIFFCVLGVLLPIILYNMNATPVYRASVSIIYEGMSNPLTKISDDPLRSYFRETFILNRVEEIKSRSLAEEIASALPEYLIKRFNFPEERPPDFDKLNFITGKIQESISTELINRTDFIVILVESHDPLLSMSIANMVAEVLNARSHKIKRSEVSGVRKYIEEQLAIYKEQLYSSEEELKQFKEANSITSLEQESQEILRRITEVEVIYNQVKAKRESTQKRLTVIRDKLALKRDELVPTITDISNPWLKKLKNRLIDLQVQYTQLQVQDYKPEHPKMIQLQEEIKQTQKSLTAEALKLSQSDIVVDPLSQIHSYLKESFSLEIQLETLKAQEQTLRNVVNEYEKTLKTLPKKQLKLANLMRNRNVNEKIYIMLLEKREEARISEAEKIANLRIIDKAQLPHAPVRPRKKLNLAIGLFMGFLVGFGLAFVLESMNATLKTSEEIEKLTNWPVLATIPNIKLANNGKSDFTNISQGDLPKEPYAMRGLVTNFESKSMAAEAFRVLRTNIQLLNDSKNFKTILITSIGAQEGKSTTSTNLGITLTKLGQRVLIIDADMRRPKMHEIFGIAKEPGLSDVLLNHHTILNDFATTEREKEFYDKAGESPMWSTIQNLKSHKKDVNTLEENFQDFTLGVFKKNNEIIQPQSQYRNLLSISLIESIKTTRIKNLKALPSGKFLHNPSEILSTVSMQWLLEQASKNYDLILIDSPPLVLVPDSMVLSSLVSGVLIVIESNKNEQNMILNAQKFLEKTDSKVIGVVLNKVDPKMIYKDKDYYYYG